MVDKQSRMKSNNPEQPIDYNQSSKYFRGALTLLPFEEKLAFSQTIDFKIDDSVSI